MNSVTKISNQKDFNLCFGDLSDSLNSMKASLHYEDEIEHINDLLSVKIRPMDFKGINFKNNFKEMILGSVRKV